MTVEEQIANLIKAKVLKVGVRDEAAIRQYLSNARDYRAAVDEDAPALVRFTMAYEALHAISMAFFNHHAVRTDGEGHRSIALKVSIGELAKDAFKGVPEAMIRIHEARNDSTYFRPIPPVSDKLAKATLKLLDAALAGADAAIKLEDVQEAKPPGP